MNIHKRAGTLLLTLAVGACAFAQTPASKPAAKTPAAPAIDFSTLDKNADGRLSRDEVLAIADLNVVFDVLDGDHDKYVTPAEFASWPRAGKAKAVPSPDPGTAPGGSAGAQHMPSPN